VDFLPGLSMVSTGSQFLPPSREYSRLTTPALTAPPSVEIPVMVGASLRLTEVCFEANNRGNRVLKYFDDGVGDGVNICVGDSDGGS